MIHRSASTKTRLLVEKTGSGPRCSPASFFSRIRSAIQKKLESEFRSEEGKNFSEEGTILEALLLGEDGRMPLSVVQSLQATGLYHLFAISGGHIAIITFLLYSLLRLARMNPRTSSAVLILFLVCYTLLVEASPSVLRATFMTLAFLVGKLLWKDVHILNTIAASIFVLLLVNPFSLFDIGFQLTYAATLAIIMLHSRLMKLVPRLPLKLGELTALSASAMAGVLPIIVRHFNRVTFSSLILNCAAIPLTGLIMGLGYVYLPLAFIVPHQARLLAPVLKALIILFVGISHLFDSLPFLSYRIPTPGALTVTGYYVFLGLLLLPSRFRAQRPILAGGFVSFLFVLVIYPFPSFSKDLKVTMIDVGQGESLLVEFPGRAKMLIDGGGFPESRFDVGDKVVSPFLWRRGIKRLDYLVLTHPHPDHLKGLVSVAANFRIGEFWEAFAPEKDAAYEALQKSLGKRVPRRRVFSGFRHNVGRVLVEALHPNRGRPPPEIENDRSLVLRISFGDVSFLLGGDIGVAAEHEILEKFGRPAATILKAPHHGSRTSSSPSFLDGVAPKIVLISLGEGNLFGFPHREVLDRFRGLRTQVWRTDLHGAIEVATDGRRIRIRTATGRSRQQDPPRLTTEKK
jgi:competence protein ComEC